MTSEKLSQLRAVIVKANPDILKLDTGCRIRIADRVCSNHAFNDTIPANSKSLCTVIAYDPGGRIGDDYEGATLTVWCDERGIARSWGKHGWDDDDCDVPEHEIVGRPIRLADW
jgi:hypothetical protein